jgi:CheY-like chemotaxis protein
MITDFVCSATTCEEELRHGGEFLPPIGNTLNRPIKTVLLAEDDEDDMFMMKLACERSGIPHLLQIVTDGAMAIDYLSGKGAYADQLLHPRPNIIFLDIKMPKQSGFEVLKLVRAKQTLKKIPVIMLSSSPLTADVDRAYQLGVASYLRKIPNQTEFGQAIRGILKHWLELEIPS